jgi:hypothetical protein
MFFQTLDIALNGVTNIRHRFVARFPLGNTAGQSRAFGNKNAVFIRFNRDTKFHTASVAIGGAAGNETADIVVSSVYFPKTPETQSLHIRVRAFAMFSDEAVDPRRDKRNLGRRDALQELEFVPPRVEVRDFVACRFQLRRPAQGMNRKLGRLRLVFPGSSRSSRRDGPRGPRLRKRESKYKRDSKNSDHDSPR